MPKFIHKGDAKKEYVRNMFNDVSKRYDLLNKLLSFGIDSYWRNRLIKSMAINNNSIILDYFTGSGTTGHAVLELNKQDNGNRKFILVTNNENNIMDEICYPRIQSVIEGYKFESRNW